MAEPQKRKRKPSKRFKKTVGITPHPVLKKALDDKVAEMKANGIKGASITMVIEDVFRTIWGLDF